MQPLSITQGRFLQEAHSLCFPTRCCGSRTWSPRWPPAAPCYDIRGPWCCAGRHWKEATGGGICHRALKCSPPFSTGSRSISNSNRELNTELHEKQNNKNKLIKPTQSRACASCLWYLETCIFRCIDVENISVSLGSGHWFSRKSMNELSN